MESKDSKPESYKKIKELGKGACGKAYLVICESTKGYAVIKQIDINSIKSREEREKVYQVRNIYSLMLMLYFCFNPVLLLQVTCFLLLQNRYIQVTVSVNVYSIASFV